MGLVDNKKNVFTTIGSYTSVIQAVNATDTTNLFPSINNKKDVVPFMLDILKVVAGSTALQELTGQLFTNLVDKIEPQLKTAMKKQVVQYNSGDGLPAQFTTGSGYSVKAKDIDVYGKLKTNPNSAGGNLIYDSGLQDFDGKAYNAIQNAGTFVNFGGLMMKYDTPTDSFVFKSNGSSPNIGQWSTDYIDSLKIINKKEFITNTMNAMFGTLTKSQNKTVDEVYQELQVNKLLEQMINDDDSMVISPADNEELQRQAQQMVNGVLSYDLGCGLMAAVLPMSGMTSLVSSISGSTDAFFVGNQISAVIDSSIPNQDTAAQNQQTVKDGFFQRLIKIITQALAQAMTTAPQIRAILAIISAFQNGIPQIGNPKDDLKKFKTVIMCNIKAAMRLINEFIYNLIVKFLVILLVPVIKKIIKEKINQYVGIVKSLTTG
jgi:hypothetical protein